MSMLRLLCSCAMPAVALLSGWHAGWCLTESHLRAGRQAAPKAATLLAACVAALLSPLGCARFNTPSLCPQWLRRRCGRL